MVMIKRPSNSHVRLVGQATNGRPASFKTVLCALILLVAGILLLSGLSSTAIDDDNATSDSHDAAVYEYSAYFADLKAEQQRQGTKLHRLAHKLLPSWSLEYLKSDVETGDLDRGSADQTRIASSAVICPTCDCSVKGSYSDSLEYTKPLPSVKAARSLLHTSPRQMKRFLQHHIQLYSWTRPMHISDQVAAKLMQKWLACPDAMMALNFRGLDLNKPTLYAYTRTGSRGRLTADNRRLRYLQRHADTFRAFQELVQIEGYYDGEHYSKRQYIWIIIEDATTVSAAIAELLEDSGLPYLYIAHGETHRFGNAQWQIAERAVHVLRDSFFGDGPVMNIDDDSRILPELLSRVWRVKKAIFWQVGNMGHRQNLWEGPIFANARLISWKVGGLFHRKFPIDMNGFAVNNDVIGDDRPVHPPKYLPVDQFGGESEYLEQILKSRDEVEALCDDSATSKCHMAWHNWVERPQPKPRVFEPQVVARRRQKQMLKQKKLAKS